MKAYKEKPAAIRHPISSTSARRHSGTSQRTELARSASAIHRASESPRKGVSAMQCADRDRRDILIANTRNPPDESSAGNQFLAERILHGCRASDKRCSLTNPSGPRKAPLFEFDRLRLRYQFRGAHRRCYALLIRPAFRTSISHRRITSLMPSVYSGPGSFGTVGKLPGTPFDTAVWQQGGTGLVRPYAVDPYVRLGTQSTPVNTEFISDYFCRTRWRFRQGWS